MTPHDPHAHYLCDEVICIDEEKTFQAPRLALCTDSASSQLEGFGYVSQTPYLSVKQGTRYHLLGLLCRLEDIRQVRLSFHRSAQ